MSFKQLRELVSDNESAVKLIETLEQSTNDNIQKINTLEKTNGDLLGEVKNFKQGNTLVKDFFGIDQLNEDTLKEAVNKNKGDKGDDVSQKEIQSLREKIEALNGDIENTKNESGRLLSTKDIEIAYLKTGLPTSFEKDTKQIDIELARDHILRGAALEDGNVVYKNSDGSTIYNSDGRPLSINDKVMDFKESTHAKGMLKADILPGSNTRESNGGGNTQNNRSKMTPSEKATYITEHGQDAYLKLPN